MNSTAAADRRVGKTIAAIRSALIEEIKESGTKDISVSTLCRRADIGRGTFYTHFDGVHDVLQEIEDDFIQHIRDFCFSYFEMTDFSEAPAIFNSMLEYISHNGDLFRIFLYNPGSDFTVRTERQIYELFYYHNLKYHPDDDEVLMRYGVTAGLGAVLGILRAWYGGGMNEEIGTVACILSETAEFMNTRSKMKGVLL